MKYKNKEMIKRKILFNIITISGISSIFYSAISCGTNSNGNSTSNHENTEIIKTKNKLWNWVSIQNDKSNLPNKEEVFNLSEQQLENLDSKIEVFEFIASQKDKVYLPNSQQVFNLSGNQLENLDEKKKLLIFVLNHKYKTLLPNWKEVFNSTKEQLDNLDTKTEILDYVLKQENPSNLLTWQQIFNMSENDLKDFQFKIDKFDELIKIDRNYLPNLKQIFNLNEQQLTNLDAKISLLTSILSQTNKAFLPTWEEVFNMNLKQINEYYSRLELLNWYSQPENNQKLPNRQFIFGIEIEKLKNLEIKKIIINFVFYSSHNKNDLPNANEIFSFTDEQLHNIDEKIKIIDSVLTIKAKNSPISLPSWKDIINFKDEQIKNYESKIEFLNYASDNIKQECLGFLVIDDWKKVFNLSESQLNNFSDKRKIMDAILKENKMISSIKDFTDPFNWLDILNLQKEDLNDLDEKILRYIGNVNYGGIPFLIWAFTKENKDFYQIMKKHLNSSSLPNIVQFFTFKNALENVDDTNNVLGNYAIAPLHLVDETFKIPNWKEVYSADKNQIKKWQYSLFFYQLVSKNGKNYPNFETFSKLSLEQLENYKIKSELLNLIAEQEQMENLPDFNAVVNMDETTINSWINKIKQN
ncbi:hypothetical protein [Mesomycoplasma lagogenitalium]|uniref:Lipoprotein n=1 Tax=Mesomycoplasma lagogenitalium TaxID=171286 RepID=A0ABY8LVC5_9BACT|nr:hypothetical protein [Mesomycoplasma lagogenitalium]WGI36376.1 hypothetical protein QEG99_02795 [Mesomycoplasma lagogenitalium]